MTNFCLNKFFINSIFIAGFSESFFGNFFNLSIVSFLPYLVSKVKKSRSGDLFTMQSYVTEILRCDTHSVSHFLSARGAIVYYTST